MSTLLKRGKAPETELDKIIEFMVDLTGSVKLDEKRMLKYERIQYADQHLRQQYSFSDTVALLIKRFGVSRATATNDIRDAKYVHGSVGRVNLEYEKQELLEVSRKNIKLTLEDRDPKALTKALEAHTNILKLFKEEEQIPWDKVQANQYIFAININAGDPEQQKYKINLDKLEKLNDEEVKFLQDRLESHFDDLLEKTLIDGSSTTIAAEATVIESNPSDSDNQ